MTHPPSSWDPSGEVARTLRTLVEDHGRQLLSDPVLLSNLCADVFDESARREVNLIVDAARDDVASMLEQQMSAFGPNQAVNMTAATFADHRNLALPPAQWVVAQFALSLGFQVDPGTVDPPGDASRSMSGVSTVLPDVATPGVAPDSVAGAPMPPKDDQVSPTDARAIPTRDRSPRRRAAIALAAAAATAVVGILVAVLVLTGSSPSPRSPMALSPATVPPVVGVCTEQLQFGADGVATPLTCVDGSINKVAWHYYAKLGAPVLRLGRDATPGQVTQSLCEGLTNSTIPIQTSAYHLASAYYGWRFGVDPSNGLTTVACG